MNTLKLNKLRLKNFKGIKDFTLEPGGVDTSVYGDNATGKTTLQDAFFYLIFGRDSRGKADFQLKPVDASGAEIHNLDTEVEAGIEHNGKATTLMKRYKEKWTKKRGSARAEFTGHTTDHFIDDVPAKKKEFEQRIDEIVKTDVFNLVTDPLAFNNLHWQDRRNILLQMCGDVPDEEVIKSERKLETLSGILSGGSIEDHRKKVKAKQKQINDELKQIPARIDENKSSLDAREPDTTARKNLESLLEKEKEKLNSIHNGEQESEKRRRLNEIESEISKAKTQVYKGQAEQEKPIREKIEALQKELPDPIKHDKNIDDLKENITRLEKRMTELRDEWHYINNDRPKASDTCPTCGQGLPEDQIESARENFNHSKAQMLKEINQKGIDAKKQKEEHEQLIEKEKELLHAAEKEVDRITKEIEAEKERLQSIGTSEPDTTALEKEKSAVQMELDAIRNGTATQEKGIKQKITELEQQIADIARDEAAYQAAEKARQRITELEKQEKTLAEEYESLESEMHLIETFIVKKVELVEEKINSRFDLARFKLFETQINDGVKETCETIYNGVPFNHGLNSGARLNVGIDIINTLSDYYQFQAPVWIDNAESVTDIIKTDSQVISLVVYEGLNELQVLAEKSKKAS